MESSNGHAAATQTSNISSESEVQNSLGCGCSNTNSTKSPTILISVTPTTGGQFEIPVLKSDTIENVKKIISKKLKVPRDRICLLHRERQLRDGSTVQENQLVEGSRLTLLPSVETGLLAQRPEQSVMQALESLNDSQVNDFLSGKAPLNLTMRLGDHMMLIQLQLSTISPSTSRRSATSTASSSSSLSSSSSSSSSSPKKSPSCKVHSSNSSVDIPIETAAMATTTSVCSSEPAAAAALKSQTSSMVDNIRSVPSSTSSLTTTTSTSSSVPLCKNVPCKCGSTSTTKPLLDTRALAEASRNLTQTLKQLSSEVLTSKSDTKEESSSPSSACSSPSSSVPSSPTHTTSEHSLSSPSPSTSSSPSCHSTRESTSSSTSSSSSSNSKRRQGAIIESMHHHGKGVYSGTFSGTLNPALQDKFGRPKRDISTIIHILNDLLCATPQYRAARSSASHATSVLDMGPASIDSAASASAAPIKSTSDISTNTDVKMLNSSSPADSLENQATRDKMERLRVVMEERRERRRAKRSAPYTCPSGSVLSTQWSAKSESRDVLSESMDTESTPTITPEPVVV